MSKVQTETVQIFFGVVLWVLVTPLALPLLIFLSLWKMFALFYIKIKYFKSKPSPLLEPTNFVDTMFCITELSNTITYALMGDGIIDVDKLRSLFYNTFIEDGKDEQFPVFHQTFTTIFGYSYKIRAPLDLFRHIREEDFSPGGEETENEAFLRITENNSEIRGNVPKWEMILLQNRVEGKSTLIWKMSHGLVDAYSFRSLLAILTDNHGTYRTPEVAKPKGTMHQVKLFARIPVLLLQNYTYLNNANFNTHPFLGAVETPDEPIGDKIKISNTPSKLYWSKGTLELNKLKQISKQSGCRIGPICVSLYISTLRRSLMERGIWDENRITRDTPMFHALPVPNHPADLGRYRNHAAPAITFIPLKIHSKIRQLKTVHERMEEYEQSEICQGTLLFGNILAIFLPKFLISYGVTRIVGGLEFSSVVNPFIFSPEEYTILGVGVTSMFYLTCSEPPVKIRGAILTPLTLLGSQMNISVHGSEDVFGNQRDADEFMKIFMDEVKILGRDVEKWASSRGFGSKKGGLSLKNKKVQFQCQ